MNSSTWVHINFFIILFIISWFWIQHSLKMAFQYLLARQISCLAGWALLESVKGREWPKEIFHDQSHWKNDAETEYRSHNLLITSLIGTGLNSLGPAFILFRKVYLTHSFLNWEVIKSKSIVCKMVAGWKKFLQVSRMPQIWWDLSFLWLEILWHFISV